MKKVFATFVVFASLLTVAAHAASDTIVIDASGSDGSYSGDDAARGGNIVLHLSYADAAKTVVAITGTRARGSKVTEINQQVALKDVKTILARSRGGDGANGSSGSNGSSGNSGSDGWAGRDGSDGSNGSDGCPPGSGGNGSSGTDGSDGTNGTDGYDGGNGGSGGDGGSGGSVIVTTAPDQSELLLLVQIDVRRGEGGSGGSGGYGGTGGRGGSGGRGGRGGSGGRGGTNTCTDDKGNRTGGSDGSSGWQGSNGRDGSDGRSGSNGRNGSSGYSGSNGRTGSKSFQLVAADGSTQSFEAPFHLEVASATFIDDDEDGILQPGERAHLVSVQLKNTGPMPSPAAQTVLVSLIPSSTLIAPGALVAAFPVVAPNALSEPLQFRKGQLMMQAPNRNSLIGEKAVVGLTIGINNIRTGGDLDSGMAIGWPISVSGTAKKLSGNFSVAQQLSFTLKNGSNKELGPRGTQRFEVALDWQSKSVPGSDVYVALADGRVVNLASPVEIRDLTVPAQSTAPLAFQFLVRSSKGAKDGSGTLNVYLKLQNFNGSDDESLQKLPIDVSMKLDIAAIQWAQEIQLRDAKISCDFYKLGVPAKQQVTSIVVQKAKGSKEMTVKVGAAALLSPELVVPASTMLPYYEGFQGKWNAQLAVDFLNKLASPGSPKKGPWAFKNCAVM